MQCNMYLNAQPSTHDNYTIIIVNNYAIKDNLIIKNYKQKQKKYYSKTSSQDSSPQAVGYFSQHEAGWWEGKYAPPTTKVNLVLQVEHLFAHLELGARKMMGLPFHTLDLCFQFCVPRESLEKSFIFRVLLNGKIDQEGSLMRIFRYEVMSPTQDIDEKEISLQYTASVPGLVLIALRC